MNKAELVETLANDSGLSKVDAERTLNSLIETIVGAVKKGDKVAISGLGSFERVKRAARTGVNPATGAKIQIKAKNAPKFKAAKAFKETVQ